MTKNNIMVTVTTLLISTNSGKLFIYKVAKHDGTTVQYSEDGGADKWRNRFNGRANYIIILPRTLHQKVIMVDPVPRIKASEIKIMEREIEGIVSVWQVVILSSLLPLPQL